MKRFTFRGVARYLDGYTIIEVIIFLAVSGALLLASINLISGRQQRVRFSQGIVSFEQQLQDTFNDVSTGYFPSNSDFKCTFQGGDLVFTDGGGNAIEQGANTQCIFVGKLIHFYADDSSGLGPPSYDNNKYKVYTLVASKDTTTDPRNGRIELLGFNNNPGIFDLKSIEAGVQLGGNVNNGNRRVIDTANNNQFHSIVVLTTFNQAGPNNAVSGNASNVKLYGYRGWSSQGILRNFSTTDMPEIVGPLAICLEQDNSSGRKAALLITPQLTIERRVDINIPGGC